MNDYLSIFQSQLLRDKIAEEWKKPNDELLPILMEYAQLGKDYEGIVEAFMVSWKHTHPDGPIKEAPKRAKVIVEEGEETFEDRLAKEVKQVVKQKSVSVPGAGSIIDQILTHYKAGKTRAEIVALGFNKSTVARQCGEYEKNKNK